ncbi:helix-turn-helix domain-containing protein [Streptomyces sp. PSKA54]|uniref:Helix-turn-helix domain-containing protein n=1 Tax=Streptomyces himalayensis subsp. aureolus TaxID=2758039 RepID=A0A7W2D8P5_9ACTN|nr:helix-turn-helix domain-containing protein [Streptomyces himalayensis]MBA4866839.1 helix-turn-helix domain-containing protein [Streptomyces himalayensis subsp. aureolus]
MQIVRDYDEEPQDTTVCNRFGEVRSLLVEGGPREMIRPGRLLDLNADGYLSVCRPLAGEILVFQDGKHAAARGAQLVCYDSSRPYKVIMPERFRAVILMLPRRLLGLTAKDTEMLTANVWDGSHGLGALMSDLLVGLEQHGEHVDTGIDLLGGSVAGLAAALFTERLRSLTEEASVGRSTLMLSIQAFIRERLADPDLCPMTVAQQHNVSLRYLQKICHERNTSPARWIRDERLARCRSELADPRFDHLSIAAIGERSGFYGASHFSRLFGDRYGVTPREFRKKRGALSD